MSNPNASALHINTPLTNIAVGSIQSEDVFIARKVFPVVPVAKQTDLFRTFNIADFYRDDMKPRAAGTESHGTGWNVGEDSYICKRWDLHTDIDDEARANSDSVFNLDATTTRSLTNKALIRQDSSFVAKYMVPGKWATDLVGTTDFVKWSDDTSDPVDVVESVKLKMLLLTGHEPNKCTMSYDVAQKLKTNPAIIDRIKYSGGISNDKPVNVSMQAIGNLFGMEIIVSKAIKNINAEGQPMNGELIAKNVVLFTYSPSAPSLFDMSAGYIFTWTGLLKSQNGMRIKKFRMENIESDRVEIQTCWDDKLVSNGCGALLTAVI